MIIKSLIPERLAINGLLITLFLIINFHLLVMAGVIPYEIVWGGRLADKSQMLALEAVSVIINLLMLVVIIIRSGLLKVKISKKIINTILWMMSILFLLNTVGNLLSENELEKIVFTPLTFILFIFSLRLAIGNSQLKPLNQNP